MPSVGESKGEMIMSDSYSFKCPVGVLKVCEENNRITGLSLLGKDMVLAPSKNAVGHSDLLFEAYKQLNEYFAGNRVSFDLPLQCTGTVFQQKVWEQLQKIPYGETRSYEDIAIAVGNKKAVRAVGQANNRNPVLILVPCHRVIHKNGDISGFGCGMEVKKYLLDLEKSNLSKHSTGI